MSTSSAALVSVRVGSPSSHPISPRTMPPARANSYGRRQTLNTASFLTTPVAVGSATKSPYDSPLDTPDYAESFTPSEELLGSLSPAEKRLNGLHVEDDLPPRRSHSHAARTSQRRTVPPPPPPATRRSRTEYAGHANEKASPRGAASSRRGKVWCWAILLVAVVALALGLGLHFGLKNRTPNDGRHRKELKLPSMGLATDSQGMSETGSFYTSSDYSNSRILQWSEGGFNLQDANDGDSVDLTINLDETHQPMEGFGAAFTDSSCWLLNQLRGNNGSDYDVIMDYFFNNRTGMSAIRIPIGASDYSAQGEYTYAETNGSTLDPAASSSSVYQLNATYSQALSSFTLNSTQEYIMPVLKDAIRRNPAMRIWMSAWSPPAWMKTSNDTNGGQLLGGTEALYAEYLTRTVVSYSRAGVRPTTLTIQNEPSRGTEGYPSNWMSPQQQAVVAAFLRIKLNQVGFNDVQIFGLDDNWSGFQSAVDQLAFNATSSTNSDVASGLTGIAWHCYNGSPNDLDTFNGLVASNAAIANKTIPQHLTECTTTDNSDNQWYSIKFWLNNMFFGMVNRDVRSVITWNVVLDRKSKPYIKTAPCHDCLGTFTISSPDAFQDPSLTAWNVQSTLVYHFASATSDLTRLGGGQAHRVGGNTLLPSASKRVAGCISEFSAFAAPWNGTDLANSRDKRVGLVVQNDCSGDVSVNIGVTDGQRNQRGTFKFKGGLTTLVFVT